MRSFEVYKAWNSGTLFLRNPPILVVGTFFVVGGGLDAIVVAELPGIAVISLVVHLAFPPAECDQPHLVALEIYDPDGAQFLRIENAKAGAGLLRPLEDVGGYFTQIFNIVPLMLVREGNYEFRVLGDGNHHLGSVTLPVRLAPQPGNQEAAS